MTEFKQHSNIALQLLVKSQQGNLGVDVKELMAFQLTPVPYSLGTADRFMSKTDKSSSFHFLNKSLQVANTPPLSETLTVIDGNAVFHSMVQVPPTFRQICVKLLEMMPSTSNFIFSTNMYQEGSIKSM